MNLINYATCRSNILQPGQYHVSVKAQTPFEYFVNSYPTGTEAVRIVSWISPTNYNYTSGELPVIEADIMKGRSAVLNANVTALTETGSSKQCNISLRDDGNGKFVIYVTLCHIIYTVSYFVHFC